MKLRITLTLVLIASCLSAMPPDPAAWQRLTAAEKARANLVRLEAIRNGLDQPQELHMRHRELNPDRDDPDETVLRVPVILVDFVDNAANQQAHPVAHYERMLFSEGEVQTGSVNDFYLENSFGEVVIAGEAVGWVRAPQTYAYYTNRLYGLGNYPRNAQRLAEDAIRAADNNIDFSQYDNDGDGLVEAPFIVHAGGGAEENPNNVNIIWSHAWDVQGLGELDGVRFNGYTMVPEDGEIGVFSHELGHALFGLPDLYDTGGDAAGLGMWSVMSYGAWGDNGRRPVQFDGWCKSQLGWIVPQELRWDSRITLYPAESSGRVMRLWHPDRRGDEYFLVEYRDRSGFDGELPGAGLLVYHVDEAMQNNDHPWYPGHHENLHDLIALEQADNNYDLEVFENAGDAGDPYPGRADNRTFDNDSEPGSLDYDGEATGIAIRNIVMADSGVTADWIIGVEGPPIISQTLQLRGRWNLVSLRVTPGNLDIRQIMSPLVERGILRLVKDGSGRFYTPDHDFNNIPMWDLRGGLYLNLSEAADLVIEGELIEYNRPIPLRQGWQTTAYYPESPIPVERALESLGDDLIMAKDGDGRFYLPRLGFNNMNSLQSGSGYLIRLAEDRELRYPEE